MPPREMSTPRAGTRISPSAISASRSQANRVWRRLSSTRSRLLRRAAQRFERSRELGNACRSQRLVAWRRLGGEILFDLQAAPFEVQTHRGGSQLLAQLGQPDGFAAGPQLLGIEHQPVEPPGGARFEAQLVDGVGAVTRAIARIDHFAGAEVAFGAQAQLGPPSRLAHA